MRSVEVCGDILNFFKKCLSIHKSRSNAWDQEIINTELIKSSISYGIFDKKYIVCSEKLSEEQKETYYIFKKFQNIRSKNKKVDSHNDRLKYLLDNNFVTEFEFNKYKL